MVSKYADLYLNARQALLSSFGAQQASFVASQLVAHAANKTVAALLASRELYASEAVCERVQEYLARALAGEPLAYILGQWDFHGMTLTVTPDVLIPRDDTEVVAQLAIRTAKFLPQNPRILDLCTGSGCIGLAVAREVADARVTLADLSPAALRVARRNTAQLHLGARVSCVALDARAPAPSFLGRFDLIVSNPPYVTQQQLQQLEPSVRDYEPALALDGGEDGLAFYRAIVQNYAPALRPGGYLALEFGQGQQEAVSALLRRHGFEILEIRKDTGGIDRAVLAQDTREE